MPTFKKDSGPLADMAAEILKEFQTHWPIVEAEVRVDYLFAFGDVNENGETVGDALKRNGVKALGITRKLSLKDRAKGLGDAEICIDGDWWDQASPEDQRALLDHELHHISVVEERRDDLGRPVLKLRKHDWECGFFAIIAQRHGIHSMERQQAKKAMDTYGQYFWPEVVEVMGQTRFKSIAAEHPGWTGELTSVKIGDLSITPDVAKEIVQAADAILAATEPTK